MATSYTVFRQLESMRGCFFFRSNFKPRTTIQRGFSRYLEISLKLVREESLIVQREYWILTMYDVIEYFYCYYY